VFNNGGFGKVTNDGNSGPVTGRLQGSGQADENVSGNGSRPGAAQYYETASIIHFNFRALSKGSFQVLHAIVLCSYNECV
jgi:hypothetical protein